MTSLKRLERKKLDVGMNRLGEFGIDVERWLAMLNASNAEMQQLVAAWPICHPSYVYDAASVSRILGIACESGESIPEAANGEVIVYYGGWELPQLRDSVAGKARMWQDQTWYNEKGWKAAPGYYRLLLPVPDSNRKSWDDQIAFLAAIDAAWKAAPICVAATALLVHLAETGNDLLENDWCRCAEALPDDFHAVLAVGVGRVDVNYYWDGNPNGRVWLSAARKS